MSSATPLRDRLQSNSPDPNNGWRSPATTPLRIAKRDSPQSQRGAQLARRQSSSYNHLRKNNLVTKSPFRSQIPTPARPSIAALTPTRRVSGEKRARPASMHQQAENEHPLGFKRRQSKGFQGLIEKEPVTKSPFRRVPSDELYQEPPQTTTTAPPRKLHRKAPDYNFYEDHDEELPPPPPPKQVFSPSNSPSPSRGHNPTASPARSSLVNKRFHGPRVVGNGSYGRNSPQKKVTFDETCDVVEYDVEEEEMDENPFDWVADNDDDGDYVPNEQLRPQQTGVDDSFDSSQGCDDSITGLMHSMLQDNVPHTPPHDDHPLPEDLETEDGVPYGRSHHADRLAMVHHGRADNQAEESLFPLPTNALSTPSHSRPGTPIGAVSPGSHIPLGRSTHSERLQAHKEEEGADIEGDVKMLPPSPSPAKRTGILPIVQANRDSLIPKFELKVPNTSRSTSDVDPFGTPAIKEETRQVELSFTSVESLSFSREQDMDPANLSIGNSEVSLSGLDMEVENDDIQSHPEPDEGSVPPSTSTPPTSPPSSGFRRGLVKRSSNQYIQTNVVSLDSPPPTGGFGSFHEAPRVGSPSFAQLNGSPRVDPRSGSPVPTRVASPLQRCLVKSSSASSLSGTPNGSLNGRSPRISREDVQKRLLKKRSVESPLREMMDVADHNHGRQSPQTELARNSFDQQHNTSESHPSEFNEFASRGSLPPMTRVNPTYDGVMSIDPEPQPIDPPRPSMSFRAHSTDGTAAGSSSGQGFTGLNLDFESGFGSGETGVGLGMSMGEVPIGDMRSALDRLMADVAGEASIGPDGKGVVGLKVEAVSTGVKAGRFQSFSGGAEFTEGHSRENATEDEHSMDCDDDAPAPLPMERAATDTMLLHASFNSPPPPAEPPQPPPKDAIRAREELIKAKKREARRREVDEDMGLCTAPRSLGIGRPSRRRSMSTGDAEDILSKTPGAAKRRGKALRSGGGLLDVLPIEDEEDPLADSIDRELRKLGDPRQSRYHIREHSETIYASYDVDRIAHMEGAGDLDGGKAWRTVRRPSDMNEYSKQIKELRAQEKTGKAHGKVFVKVLRIQNLHLPLPKERTAVTCTLNNGIHFVTTPPSLLAAKCNIGQEFELIEHSKLEFTLTFKVRRDPHIIAQFKENAPPPPRPAPVQQQAPVPASKGGGGGMRLFGWGGSPKKSHKAAQSAQRATPPPRPPSPPPVHRLSENLARYLLPDGTLARAFISFRDIARYCDTSLFELTCPLIGQKTGPGPKSQSMQVGELVVSVFRLPPLPGIPPDQLPQSLEECERGLENIGWHKRTYYEGTLTQSGGDCNSWRRRNLRIIGSNLVAFNDVTKRATATIDLKKAIAVEDDQEARAALLSPASGSTAQTSRYVDDYEGPYGSERSFRLKFPHDQEIVFFADSDEEKHGWLHILRQLVGRIPSNPLWAELVWQRIQELKKQTAGGTPRDVASPPPR